MNFIYWGRYGSVFLTFAAPLSLILSKGKGWSCWINTKLNLISEQKKENLHIFLQFTTENLNDYTMFGEIFVCSGLRQKETLSLNDASHPASATQHFLCVIFWIILFEKHLCGAKVMNRSFIAGMLFLHCCSFFMSVFYFMNCAMFNFLKSILVLRKI